MIARVRGTLVEKTPDYLVVEAAGVGYRLDVTLHTFYEQPQAGAEVTLLVDTRMSQEQIVLYGFSNANEREMFRRLTKVSGIGPRLARNILSGIRVGALSEALTTGDLKRINSIPGVGKKLAERILVDLRAKEAELPVEHAAGTTEPADPVVRDVIAALTNLGYKPDVAQRALDAIQKEDGAPEETEPLLRAALKRLTR